MNIFKRVGLSGDTAQTYITFATGGSFSKYSHEFQTVTEAGEDTIYVDEKKNIAINKEIMDDAVMSADALKELGIDRAGLVEKKAVEVGNIFSLGTRFSDAFELNYQDTEGNKQSVVMGCYGIGPGRVMGTVAEIFSDANGLIWPKEISPFSVHLIALFDKAGKDGVVAKTAEKYFADLNAAGIDVLFDDRDNNSARAGEKFADSDLIGIPVRIIVSEKTLAEGMVEMKDRKTGATEKISFEKVLDFLSQN
jgi:prolyl-tRNA synthetase